jgi:fucose permease
MELQLSKKYLHDRLVLLLITLLAVLLVIGVALVLLRFDISKNPTTIVSYRPNISGASYQSGKPIDIYSMAVFMIATAVGAVVLSARVYALKRHLSVFILASSAFLLILATIVANSLISLQ